MKHKATVFQFKFFWKLDFHRSRWEKGDFTDDTDQMILMVRTLVGQKGKVVPEDFAYRLKFWQMNGFPELGDICGVNIFHFLPQMSYLTLSLVWNWKNHSIGHFSPSFSERYSPSCN